MYQYAEVAGGARTAEHWAVDLEQRMALAEPNDTVRGVFCNGLVRLVRELCGEELEGHCLAAAGEAKFLDFFNYPITTYLRMVSTGMRLLAEKQGDVDAALRRLGRQVVVDLGRSAAGRALGMMNTGDTRSRLEGLRVAYRVLVSFGELELAWTGPRSARVTLKRVFMPQAFHEGMLMAAFEERNIRGARVNGRQVGPLANEYELSWE
ncbi:MAG TPA: TIGR02265 family protein [Archangium sp.]|jgi:uncharacterized protein (TIGR02265 family)|uniref:TIGR02265 family protein n=1 Tax=Archangium sp. TaxID=1872627 RepID=UPI002EDB3917